MKLREALTITALCLLIGSAYAFMQQADEAAALRDKAVWAGKSGK